LTFSHKGASPGGLQSNRQVSAHYIITRAGSGDKAVALRKEEGDQSPATINMFHSSGGIDSIACAGSSSVARRIAELSRGGHQLRLQAGGTGREGRIGSSHPPKARLAATRETVAGRLNEQVIV
jgi:hypothetical protein